MCWQLGIDSKTFLNNNKKSVKQMIVSTFKYKRPSGIVGQLNLSKVRSFGDRELAVIGA